MQTGGSYLERPCMCVCTVGQQALDTVNFVTLHCVVQGCPALYGCNLLSHVCCHILVTNLLEQTLSNQDTRNNWQLLWL